MKNIEKEVEKKRMNVFNIRSVEDSLRLGQLKGNHFDIVIRNLKNQIVRSHLFILSMTDTMLGIDLALK